MYEGVISLMSGGGLPAGLPTIWARYKASSMISIGDGNAVSSWTDISGRGHHATQGTSQRQPLLRTTASGLVGNTVAIEFLGTNTDPHCLNVPDMSALTGGFIAAYIINDTDTNEANTVVNTRRIWEMGNATDGYYKYTNNSVGSGIYETFGTTARKTSGDPATNALVSWHSYMVSSGPSAWTSWINNVQHFSTITNTVGFSTTPLIGGYPAGGSGIRLSNKKYAEIVIFEAAPSSAKRAELQTYFTNEYA